MAVPRTDELLSRAEAGGCKRGGRGCWRRQWELSPGQLAHDFFFSFFFLVCIPPSPPSLTFPLGPLLPCPCLSLQCLSQCPVLSPSAEGTPWLALQVTGHGFGQGPLHGTGSFQRPVRSASSPLRSACWAVPTALLGSPSLVGALVADWGQQSCHTLPVRCKPLEEWDGDKGEPWAAWAFFGVRFL